MRGDYITGGFVRPRFIGYGGPAYRSSAAVYSLAAALLVLLPAAAWARFVAADLR